MKTILCTLIFLTTASFAANAQLKQNELKQKNNFMLRMHAQQNFNNQSQLFKTKVNPYWQNVDAPHTYNSYVPQVKVPCYNAVWGIVRYDSAFPSKQFLRTADGGKTWRYDTVQAPAGFNLNTIAAIDANTCYAALNDANNLYGLGGGIFKTSDGGASWKQIGVGKIFDENSFPDFVYFFDARNGLAVGDNNGDTTKLEIYTTCDAGKTWQRVPNKNIPSTANAAYSFAFNVYTAYKNSIWFKAYDSQGYNYIYRSNDLGRHWQLFPYTLATPIFDWAFTDKNNGLGVSFEFSVAPHLVETHDGGITWADKSFTGYPMGGFVTVIPGTHTYVSTLPDYTPVYGSSYSRDGGKSWTLIDTGVNAKHSAIAFLNPLIGWSGRAGSEDPNGGMYKWKLHSSLDDNNVTDNDANVSSLTKNNLSNTINARLYPNPAKDVIKVEGLNASVKTTISIYNISGELIQQLNTTASSYTINVQKFTGGSYYITVESDKKASTLKFVKQ